MSERPLIALSPSSCHLCSRPLGSTVYVIEGRLARYLECEWCFEGRERDTLPELIHESFTPAPAPTSGDRSLDAILDKMIGDDG